MSSLVIDWQEVPPAGCRNGVLTIGNFDGVHQGHAALVAEARRQAAGLGGPAVAVTFDPHPLELLRPETFMPALTTMAERCRLLQERGADHVVVLHTTTALLNLSAAEFFAQVVCEGLQAQALVEGATFGFGRHREGHIDTLADLCQEAGLRLTVVPPQLAQGVAVSSSRVRKALSRGAVEEATTLLGHSYRLHGTVGVGARRGRRIGFPTANLVQLKTLAPGDGVYAVRAITADGRHWPGAANLGPNPTFHEQGRKVEIHLIGFDGDLYGQPLEVDFLRRLRDTRPFASEADLVAQLRQDVERSVSIAGR